MKRFVILIMLVLTSCISFSQTTNQQEITNLKPVLNIHGVWYPVAPSANDTLFCFNVDQSKYIYKQLISVKYCDTITVKQDSLINSLQKTNAINNQIIDTLKSQIKTAEKLEKAHDGVIKAKDDVIVIKDEQIKDLKTKSTVKSVMIVVITVISLIIIL